MVKIKAFLTSIILIFFGVVDAFSQSFNVRSIFNSGATAGIEYLDPSPINNATNFQLTKHKVQFVKVLRTRQPDLEDFNTHEHDPKANQLFLISKFSVARPNLSNNNYFEDIYRGELELTYITVSKTRGVWLHAANVSATESRESIKNNFTPNFRVYSVYAHVKNLKFIPFLGPGIGLNQGRFFALPIFGFWTRLTPKINAEIIVPIHAKIKYNLVDKVEFELATSYSSIHAIYREGSKYNGNDNTLNLHQNDFLIAGESCIKRGRLGKTR